MNESEERNDQISHEPPNPLGNHLKETLSLAYDRINIRTALRYFQEEEYILEESDVNSRKS